MKRRKLDIDYIYDFELMGLISSVKNYKLAWEINSALGIKLIKMPDLIIQFNKAITGNYAHFSSNTGLNKIRLLNNHTDGMKKINKCLVPEYPYLDYIFISEGVNRLNWHQLEKYLRHIVSIEMLIFIPLNMLKSKKFFIF